MKTKLTVTTFVLFCLFMTFFTSWLRADDELRANYIVTVADDFVVDLYHNGVLVPDSDRHMISETFGATRERDNIHVYRGDWLVFHVVNNRLRWGGSYYFAAAGLFEQGEFGFVSSLTSGDWSACDDRGRVNKFIGNKNFMSDKVAQKICRLWGDGNAQMKQSTGEAWGGSPLWGDPDSRDVWLKVIIN